MSAPGRHQYRDLTRHQSHLVFPYCLFASRVVSGGKRPSSLNQRVSIVNFSESVVGDSALIVGEHKGARWKTENGWVPGRGGYSSSRPRTSSSALIVPQGALTFDSLGCSPLEVDGSAYLTAVLVAIFASADGCLPI